MSELQAVLFDMDGTMCDSEPAWMATEFAIAEQYGALWAQHDALQLVGYNLLDSAVVMKQRMLIPLTPSEIVERMLSGVIAWTAREGVAWRPGALALVQQCNDAGIPTALVTMSYRRLTDVVVGAMPFGRFDTVVAGDEVVNGKPAPDPYLAAAAALGVEVGGCVAIEDSSTGSTSAVAAGCRVLVVPHHVEVPMTEEMVVAETLDGVTVEDLRAVISAC